MVEVEPPTDKRHGAHKGRTFEVLAKHGGRGHQSPGYWVMGDLGRRVLLLAHEVVVLPDEPAAAAPEEVSPWHA